MKILCAKESARRADSKRVIKLKRKKIDRVSRALDDTTAPGIMFPKVSEPSVRSSASSNRSNIYVFDDDDEAAQAFDEFYNAYDKVHAKTRSFLLD